jgi:hypothetical protein
MVGKRVYGIYGSCGLDNGILWWYGAGWVGWILHRIFLEFDSSIPDKEAGWMKSKQAKVEFQFQVHIQNLPPWSLASVEDNTKTSTSK